MFVQAKLPTPILNTSDFSFVFGDVLPFDGLKLLRELEMVALPGEILEVLEKKNGVLKIKKDNYAVSYPLYIDERFVKEIENTLLKVKKLPSVSSMQQALIHRLGSAYIWGGNYCRGIEEMLLFYPPQRKLTAFEEGSWMFKGCDCSGLLYEITQGTTPRNVSWLMDFGEIISSEKNLKPLDLILWPGHVVIVLDDKWTIESKHEWGGVVKKPLKERMELIHEEKKPFQIRRWAL